MVIKKNGNILITVFFFLITEKFILSKCIKKLSNYFFTKLKNLLFANLQEFLVIFVIYIF